MTNNEFGISLLVFAGAMLYIMLAIWIADKYNFNPEPIIVIMFLLLCSIAGITFLLI